MIKTIQEYIKKNRPFYHITPKSNLKCILAKGLLYKGEGICVVRSCEEEILNEIINKQINNKEEEFFAVIKIKPRNKGISDEVVCEDSVDEPTAPLHNYLTVDKIEISEEDVFIKDYKPSQKISQKRYEEYRLTGYKQEARPKIPKELKDYL